MRRIPKVLGISFCLFLLEIISLTTRAWGEPIRVAIIDSPVNYSHPDLAPFKDADTLEKVRIKGDGGQEIALDQLNTTALLNFGRFFKDYPHLKEQMMFLEVSSAIAAGTIEKQFPDPTERLRVLGQFVRALIKFVVFPGYRHHLNTLGTMLHGTHVAGLVTENLTPEQVQLSNVTLLSSASPARISLWKLLTLRKKLAAAGMQEYFRAVSKGIGTQNIRVVNISLGTSAKISRKLVRKRTTLLTGLLAYPFVRRYSRTQAEIFREGIRQLANDNPDVIFVIAAGNDGVDVRDPNDLHLSEVDAPNIVNVGATDYSGQLVKFSNRSNVDIEISAPGVGVQSLRAFGGRMGMSGTSMAAPIVANRIVKILLDHPAYTADEAVRELLEVHGLNRDGLTSAVIGGEFLIPEGFVGLAPDQIEKLLPLMTRELYHDSDKCRQWLQTLGDLHS